MSEETEVSRKRLVKVYRKIRDALGDLTADYEAKKAVMKEQMELIEKELLSLMGDDEEGFRTEYGTVSKVINQRFWTTDRAAFNEFVMTNNMLDLFENRIAQRNMAEYLAAHPDRIPPGLQIDRKYGIRVVKPRTKTE